MKKINYYFFSTLPTSLITLLLSYFILYCFNKNGLSQMEALLLLLFVPVIIFFSTIIIGYNVLKSQCITAIKSNLIFDKKWVSCIIIAFLSIAFFIILEYIYYFLFDSNISDSFTSKLNEVLSQKQAISSSDKFDKLPFVMANFLNYISIFLGVLIINNRLFRKILKTHLKKIII